MAPQVTFPAHTQARMAAADAAKLNAAEPTTAKQVDEMKKRSGDQRNATLKCPTLPGEVLGMNVSARLWILESGAKIAIGRGSLQAFVPLVKDVNLAMLEYCKSHIFLFTKQSVRLCETIASQFVFPSDYLTNYK